MFAKPTIKDVLIFGFLLLIGYFVVFKKEQPPVYTISPVKEIETRIQGKETEIQTINTRVVQDKKTVESIQAQLDHLNLVLEEVKNQRDTFQIVQVQDTLIGKLSTQNNHLNQIVTSQDSIVSLQRGIIESQDTIIAIGKSDLKKVKRQRNISLLVNVIQTGIIILK